MGDNSPPLARLAPREKPSHAEKLKRLTLRANREWLRALVMHCNECKELHSAFERRAVRYAEARSSAFFRVSPDLAVHRHVDMERAHSDLMEHQDDCPWAIVAGNVLQARH
jgi:hypothetical protein